MAAGVVVLAAPASASGAPAWHEPHLIAKSEGLYAESVVGAGGRGAVLWVDFGDGSGCPWKADQFTSDTRCHRVFARRFQDGRFGSPIAVSADGQDVSSPRAAFLPNGELLAAWEADVVDAQGRRSAALEAVALAPDGTRTEFEWVAEPARPLYVTTLATNREGRAVVAWTLQRTATQAPELWASYRSPGGPFEPAAKLMDDAESSDVALDDRDQTLFAWSSDDQVSARVLAPDGRSQSTEVLATDPPGTPDSFGRPVVEWMPNGGRVAAWIHAHPPFSPCGLYCPPTYPEVEAVSAPPGEGFGTPQVVSGSEGHYGLAFFPASADAMWLSWVDACECRDTPSVPVQRLSELKPGSGFTQGAALVRYPRGISALERGELYALSERQADAASPVKLTGTWQPQDPEAKMVVPIMQTRRSLPQTELAPMGGGDALLAWTTSARGSDARLYAAFGGDDDTAPEIERLEVAPRKLRRRDRPLVVTLRASEPVRADLTIRRRGAVRLSMHSRQPAEHIRFTVPVRRAKKLRRGRYTARAEATDRAGHRVVRIARFRVAR